MPHTYFEVALICHWNVKGEVTYVINVSLLYVSTVENVYTNNKGTENKLILHRSVVAIATYLIAS